MSSAASITVPETTVPGTAPAGAPPAAETPAKSAPVNLGFLARGGSLALAGVVISGALQLVLVVAVTRGLGATAAGVFFTAMAMFMILGRVGELGANTGLVRTVSRFRALDRTVDIRRALLVAAWPVLVVGVILGAATYAFAAPAAALFFDAAHEGEATDLIRLLAPLVPLASASTVALAATRGFGSMVPYVVVQNIGLPAARLLLVVGTIAAGFGSVAVGLAWGAPLAVAFAVAGFSLSSRLRRAEQAALADEPSGQVARPSRDLASEFWRFSAPRGLAGMLGMTVTWMDVLVVGAMLSTREAAIYAAASRLAIVGAYALQAIGMAIAPQISALLAKGRDAGVEAVYRTATWWLMALTWPLYLTLAAFAPFVMGVFGPGFAAGDTVLLILSLAMLVNLATGNVTTVLLMGGKSSWNLFNAGVSLALKLALLLILMPPLGLTGAAIAWAASLIFVNVAPVVQVRLFMGLRPPLGGGFVVVALATTLCYGGLGLATRYALGMSAATLAGFLVVATALYLAVLWRFREVLLIPDLLEMVGRRRAKKSSNQLPKTPRRSAPAAVWNLLLALAVVLAVASVVFTATGVAGAINL